MNTPLVMTVLRSDRSWCSALLLLSLLTLCAAGQAADAPLSIEGYSPVSYFTKGVAEKGLPEYAVENRGMTYYLASAEQVQLFRQNPDKFKPRYDTCPYSLTQGKRVPLDPTNFKVIGDTLLLFHKSESMDGLELWNQSPMEETKLLEQAEIQFTLLRF